MANGRKKPAAKKARGKRISKSPIVSTRPLEEIYRGLRTKQRLLHAGRRILDDETVDPGELARLASQRRAKIDGRRGKNSFRAYQWIGG